MRNVAMAGTVLGVGLLTAACGGVDGVVGQGKEEVATYDVTDGVTVLELDSDSGDVVVTGSERAGIKVTETLHWRGGDGNKPRTEHPVEGRTLVLRYDCPGQSWSCGVDYRVEVPKDLDVRVDTGSGTIVLRALSGPVRVQTGSGDVEAGGLSGERAHVETGSGNVEVAFAAAPREVEMSTGSGDVEVRVPQGGYNVTLETGSGDKEIGVNHDPAAQARVVVRTGSGNAKVVPR